MSNWTLFSNHGHILVCLARNPEARLRDVAADVGITERAVQKIVRDLQEGGMVSITKMGRRNSYRIHHNKPLRHDLESACTLKDLIGIVNREPTPPAVVPATENESLKPEVFDGETGPARIKPVAIPASPDGLSQGAITEFGLKKAIPDKSDQDDHESADKKERQQGDLF